MYILGISCYYHDAAAALLHDVHMLVAAAEEERFSRVKHDYGFPKNAIQFCLDQAGLDGKDLDYVVFFEKPFRKFDRILMTTLQTYPQSWKVFRETMISWMIDKLWVGTTIQSELGVSKEKLLFCEHPPVARRQCLLVLAFRRSGHSNGRRRRGMGHSDVWRRPWQ